MVRTWILYAICLVLACCALVATNSAAAVLVLAVLVLTPVVSVSIAIWQRRRVKLDFALPPATAVNGQVSLDVRVTRPRLFRSTIMLTFESRNLIMGTVVNLPVELAVSGGADETYKMPLSSGCCGHVCLSLASARVSDPLGFARLRVSGAWFEGSYTVYPQIVDLQATSNRASASSISGATYDTSHRGSDRTEVFELRDFRQGDSLKDVHWKLSAKLGELTVREASHPSDYDVMLLCDAHACNYDDAARISVLNAVMTLMSSISLSLCRQGINHSVAYRHDDSLVASPVDSLTSFEEMLDEIMSAPLPLETVTDTTPFEVYRRTHNVAKTAFVTDVLQEEVLYKLGAWTSLTVFHVNAEGSAGTAESGDYLLVHVPADWVGTHVKNVEF